MDRYFAYGSNLFRARMLERIPSARPLGPARLPDHRLALDKRGHDGSAKANVHPAPGKEVWGVVYAFEADCWPHLDAFEGGYERIAVRVQHGGERLIEAVTYRSELLTPEPVPFDWYKRLIVEGAREHGLPAPYLALLEALAARPDPTPRPAIRSPEARGRRA